MRQVVYVKEGSLVVGYFSHETPTAIIEQIKAYVEKIGSTALFYKHPESGVEANILVITPDRGDC